MGFPKNILQARLFGHPIHPMLVHFPTALFFSFFILGIAARSLNHTSMAFAAFLCLTIGLIGGILAIVFGAIDYFKLSNEHPAWKKASLHALLNVLLILWFSLLLGLQAKHYPDIPIPSITILILSAIGIITLIFSNYLGGELVYRHKIGTIQNH